MAYQLSDYDKLIAKQQAMQELGMSQDTAATVVKPKGAPEDWASLPLSFLPGGSILDKFRRGADITGGDVALEAGLTLLPFGLGKVGKLFSKGAKAAKTASDVTKASLGAGTKAAISTAKAGQFKNIGKEFAGAATAKKAAMTGAGNRGALDSLIGAADDINAADLNLANRGYKAGQASRVNNRKAVSSIKSQIDEIDPYGYQRKQPVLEQIAGGTEQPSLWDKMSRNLSKQSTIAPVSTLDKASDQKLLNEVTQKIPYMRGSAANKFNNVERAIEERTANVDSLLKGTTATVPKSDIIKHFNDRLGEIESVADRNRFRTQYKNIVRERFGGKLPDNMSLNDVNQFVRGINGMTSAAYKAKGKGNVIATVENALLDTNKNLKNIIEENVPSNVRSNIKQLNKESSVLQRGVREFKKASEEEIRPLGIHIPVLSKAMPQAVQAGTDYLGRGMASPAGKFLIPQAGVRAANQMFNPPSASAMSPSAGNQDVLSMLAGGTNEDQAGTGYNLTGGTGASVQSSPYYTLENLFKDVAAQPEEAATLIKLYELANPSGSQTAAERTASAKQQKMMGIVDKLETSLNQLGGGQGVGGWLTRAGNVLTGGAASPDIATYDALKAGISSQLSKAMGESGVLTDQDIKRALNLIPDITDSPESAQMKMAQLRELIAI